MMISRRHGDNLPARPKTKIICTLGPATRSAKQVESLVKMGMSVARLNLSHGTLEEHGRAVESIKGLSRKLDISVGIMADVPGPKYRIGALPGDRVRLRKGQEFTLTSRQVEGSETLSSVFPQGIHRDATPGHPVLLDDGAMEMRVIKVTAEDVLCRVEAGGTLRTRKGVSTPGKAPSQPFLTPQTVEALQFAAEYDVDFVGLSCVRAESDVRVSREVLSEFGSKAHLVAKIERMEAVDNFGMILEASDAIMVARGDLGVEVPLPQVPIIQKRIIRECNLAGKPVITATQMLESMIRAPSPTRAEVTDVANAIFDGTDAAMLSAETSIGRFPLKAVETMAQVATEAEAALPYHTILAEREADLGPATDDAISFDACRTAYQLNASLIVAFTESGSTAGRVSTYRPKPPILALTPSERVQRLLTLRWGVTPVRVDEVVNVEDFFAHGEAQARAVGLRQGELMVLVAGLPIGVPGNTNLLRVLKMA